MTEGVNIEKVIQKVAEEAAETEGPAKPEAPAAEDVSQFEAAMQGETGRQAVSGADAPPEVTRASKVRNLRVWAMPFCRAWRKPKKAIRTRWTG
jgi:hypothetical protein